MTETELLLRLSYNFKTITQNKKLSLQKIADECLMSRTEVSKIANGWRFPHAVTLCCMSEVMGVDPAELFKPLPCEGVKNGMGERIS